jgi:hypothetical protein
MVQHKKAKHPGMGLSQGTCRAGNGSKRKLFGHKAGLVSQRHPYKAPPHSWRPGHVADLSLALQGSS